MSSSITLKSTAKWSLLFLFAWSISVVGQCNQPLYADGASAPTQNHQQIYQANYVPVNSGEFLQGLLLVHVKFNGAQEATFFLDVGTTQSIISAEMAKRLGLPLKPAINDFGKPVFWRGKPMTMIVPDSMEVGHLTFTKSPLLVLNAKEFVLSNGFSKITYDGVLGANYLEHFALIIDPVQHTLGFALPGSLLPEQVRLLGLMQPAVVSISKTEKGWFAQGQFTEGGITKSDTVLIDTGASSSGIAEKLAQQLHLKTLSQEKQTSLDETKNVSRTNVGSLVVGSLALSNVSMLVHPTPKGDPSLHVADPSSSIGMDILSQYRVILDFPGGKMYLQPLPPPVHKITIGSGTVPPAPTP